MKVESPNALCMIRVEWVSSNPRGCLTVTSRAAPAVERESEDSQPSRFSGLQGLRHLSPPVGRRVTFVIPERGGGFGVPALFKFWQSENRCAGRILAQVGVRVLIGDTLI
jgi:hypothetical protein